MGLKIALFPYKETMPTKPHAPRGHRYSYKAVKLAKDQRTLIAGFAGLPPHGPRADALIAEIERDLTDAANLRDSVERAPSPAGRIALLLAVEQAASSLEAALRDLDQFSWMSLYDVMEEDKQFTSPSCLLHNPNDEEEPNLEELSSLARSAKALRAKTAKEARRGRGAEEARDRLIGYLAEDYHRHAEPRQGGQSKAVEFVAAALGAAGFTPPVPEKLLRMIPKQWRRPKKRP